jgi:nitrous oxide reductase accessory protein NosL
MFIKKFSRVVIFLTLLSFNLNAAHFSKVASVEPILVQKGKEKQWCPVCGMSLKAFYKTSHTAKLADETPRHYCSMRCLSVDMQEHTLDTNHVKVVDAKTEKLIDATTAFYVVGSKVPGTMAKVSKLAFKNQTDAQEFAQKYKGKVVDFASALSMAQKSLAVDIAMITKKKEKKVYPMGKKIFTKMCQPNIDADKYAQINQLKAAIKTQKLCRPLKEKQLQALSLYLWEVKRLGGSNVVAGHIRVTKDEKCPVCGMFVYKYPKWAAQIYYGEKHLSFDGVKDLMKYYFEHKEGISKILVTDYYSQKAIDATKAYYVLGSDIYGPMGNELIPFEHKSDAKTFYMDHKGREVVAFDKIVANEVHKLDE